MSTPDELSPAQSAAADRLHTATLILAEVEGVFATAASGVSDAVKEGLASGIPADNIRAFGVRAGLGVMTMTFLKTVIRDEAVRIKHAAAGQRMAAEAQRSISQAP